MGWRLQAPICTDGTGTANMAILTFSPHVFNFVSSWVPMQGVNSPPKHPLFQTSAQLRSDRDVQNLVKYELLKYKHLCRDLLQRVIEHNPADSTAFNNLGHLLSASDVIQVQLQGGPREFTKKGLHLESIRLDNGNARAYNNLGILLSADEVIQVRLQGGPREFTKKGLYLESIRLDNGNARAYNNLGILLSADEVIQVQLQGGPREFTKKGLHLESIRLDNGCALAYYMHSRVPRLWYACA